MFNKTRNIYVVAALLFVIFSLPACITGRREPPPDLSGVKTIAVLPFINMDETEPQAVDIEIKKGGKKTNRVAENASDALTEYFVSALKKNTGFTIKLLPKTSRRNFDDSSLVIEEEVTAIADAIVVGRIFFYKDRKGSDYFVSAPASVSFDIRFIRGKDGSVLFYRKYDETQSALLSNLLKLKLFLKRKGRWLTADEMAFSGVDKIMEDFKGL